jgi:predicted PurR-regulated permease PerM
MTERIPKRRIPVFAFLAAAGVILSIWLVRQALAPFFLAIVFAYLQVPLVEYLSRRMKRDRAVLLVVSLALVLQLGIVLLVVPPTVAQLVQLVKGIPAWRAGMELRWSPWFDAHPWMREHLRQGLEGIDPAVVMHGILGTGMGVLAWVLEGMTLFLVPVLVYYLLLEGPGILGALDGLVPARHQVRVRLLVGTIHLRLGGYIRGQIGVGVVMAILQGIGFWLIGVPYAWLLGLIAGLSNVIPHAPYALALLPALVVSGLAGASTAHLAAVATVFTSIQMSEAFYFTPVWVGRGGDLHPLEVLLAMLCFGFAFGFIGLIFAVPLMIVTKVVLQTVISDYKTHPWFEGGSAGGENPET